MGLSHPSAPAQAYSVHSYGKTGYQLNNLAQQLEVSVNSVHTPNATSQLPVVFTEHSTHTTSDFSASANTLDTPSEASRLAAQLLYLAANGVDSYVFKVSTTPASKGGIAKTGLNWGDVDAWPWSYGAPTYAAEAMRLVTTATLGGKTVETVASYPTSTPAQYPGVVGSTTRPPIPCASQPDSSSGATIELAPPRRPTQAYRPAYSIRDGAARRSLIFVNDGIAGSLPAPQVALGINLAAWNLPVGTIRALPTPSFPLAARPPLVLWRVG